MTGLTDANADVRTAYEDHIETLAEGAIEEIEADPACDRDRLFHETADASEAVTHHPFLALAASRNAPRIEDVPDADKMSLAYRAVKQDLREKVSELQE